ncbi:peptidase inhibitor family I36 protein [Saccharothrix coeruleofusca]|uniref:Peptidase inhibitor family I36 n=1 Tax=Saccharothrix coeruleofusca TaxID=33919 RepID=A0A918AQF3_9PSEU|nr:peptidase inhibitor family I36 protein [Saccharothrix coeruleofusca]MBP2337853.1 hypothetical protein [Saccharothrix coeruleofusca]GGP62713.1 hypothetical protein GCM10010185_38990 [Saccharothrix coeruleofusca]
MRLLTGIAAGLAAAATAVVLAPAASAAPAACDGWRVGVFANPNFSGTPGCFNQGAPDLRAFGLDNAISSGWNRDTVPWCLYDGYNYTQPFAQMAAGASYPDFGWASDRTSSLRRGAC